MLDIKYEIIKQIGTICISNNETVEFRIVKWNNGIPKYDLRHWGNQGKTPYKGETFSEDELRTLYSILKQAINSNKSNVILHTFDFGKGIARIYQIFGEYRKSNDFTGYVSYTLWSKKMKYDIRTWNKTFTAFGKGVSFDQVEVEHLLALLENELHIEHLPKENYDTSSIDEILI